MRSRIAKLLLPLAAVAALVAALPLAQAGTARNHAVNSSVIAHDVQTVGDVTIGAGILRDKLNGEGAVITRTRSAGGTELDLKFKSYFPTGSQRGEGTVDFTVTPAGTFTFTGSGRYTGGSGKFRGITGRITFDGTIDSEGFLRATIKGSARY